MQQETVEPPDTTLTDAEMELVQRAAAVRGLAVDQAASAFYLEQVAESYGVGRRRRSARVYQLNPLEAA